MTRESWRDTTKESYFKSKSPIQKHLVIMIILNLSVFVSVPILTEWLDVFALLALDTSMCNKLVRSRYLDFVKTFCDNFEEHLNKTWGQIPLTLPLLHWCRARNLKLRNVQLTTKLLNMDNSELALFVSHASIIRGIEIRDPKQNWTMLSAILTAMEYLEEVSVHDLGDSYEQLAIMPLKKVAQCLTNRCPRLRRLLFKGCTAIDQSTFIELLRTHPDLVDLELPRCKSWNRDFLLFVVVNMRKLRSLSIPYSIPDNHISPLLMHPLPSLKVSQVRFPVKDLRASLYGIGPHLEALHLSLHSSSVTDEHLLLAASVCPLLTRLNLKWCVGITPAALEAALPSLPLLRELLLGNTKRQRTSVINKIAECCPHLQSLYLRDASKTIPLDLKRLTKCTALQSVTLHGVGLSDAMLISLLKECPRLTYLNIADNPMLVTSYSCGESSHLFARIEHLCLKQCHNVYFQLLPLLAQHCSELKTLDVFGCRLIRLAGLLAVIAANRKLTSLNISGCIFTAPEAYKQIAEQCRNTSLRSLKMIGCNVNTHDVIMIVETLPKLRELVYSVNVSPSRLLAINPELQF